MGANSPCRLERQYFLEATGDRQSSCPDCRKRRCKEQGYIYERFLSNDKTTDEHVYYRPRGRSSDMSNLRIERKFMVAPMQLVEPMRQNVLRNVIVTTATALQEASLVWIITASRKTVVQVHDN